MIKQNQSEVGQIYFQFFYVIVYNLQGFDLLKSPCYNKESHIKHDSVYTHVIRMQLKIVVCNLKEEGDDLKKARIWKQLDQTINVFSGNARVVWRSEALIKKTLGITQRLLITEHAQFKQQA